MRNRFLMIGIAVAAVLVGGVAQAQVVNYSLVTVGDPGNAADTGGTVGAGSVGYTYQIGQYDVTIAQYTAFLNAVASSDPYGLYNSTMATQYVSYGGETVIQSGSPGSYTYSSRPPPTPTAILLAPTFLCSMFPGAMPHSSPNSMGNGQPTNLGEAAGSTETGAYTLNGDTTELPREKRNAGATYALPSVNEWYKAAYYNASANNGTYYAYPTQSNTARTRSQTGDESRRTVAAQSFSRTVGYFCKFSPAPSARSTWPATFGSGTRTSSAVSVVGGAGPILTPPP